MKKNIIVLQACIAIVSILAGLFVVTRNDPEAIKCSQAYKAPLPEIKSESMTDNQIQQLSDSIVSSAVRQYHAKKGLSVIQSIDDGKIVAIAAHNGEQNNRCFYGRAEAFKAYEPGSVVKTLTITAALNERKLTLDDEFYNPGYMHFGNTTIVNAINLTKQNYTYQDMITKSINMGAISALSRLGGTGKIDQPTRDLWHDYLTETFRFGKPTGAWDGEQSGYAPGSRKSAGIEARYAYTAFGIGLTATPVQLTSAYAAVMNEGKYVAPKLSAPENNESAVTRISPATSSTVRNMLTKAAATSNSAAMRPSYNIGGKSGTGPLADGSGTYQFYKSSGTYIGFIGKEKPKYVILVNLYEPEADVLAGVVAARTWAQMTNGIIDHNLLTN